MSGKCIMTGYVNSLDTPDSIPIFCAKCIKYWEKGNGRHPHTCGMLRVTQGSVVIKEAINK